MTATRLYLVRHAAVTVRPEEPGPGWHLSPEGRAAIEAVATQERWGALATVHASPEPKAVATAQRIAAPHELRLQIDRDLREVEGREWTEDDYAALVRRYLAGEQVDGWEPRDAASGRITACIDAIAASHANEDAAVVSHGLVLTLYLAALQGLDPAAAFELWSGIAFPDVAVVDANAREIVEPFGAS